MHSAGGSPAVARLRPTFCAPTEIALEQSQAQVRELEEQNGLLQTDVRNLRRIVSDQQQVIDALEDRESYEKLHTEWEQVVHEIDGQNKFVATLQSLVEKQERQLLENKGIATELAAAKNELAAFEKQVTGMRQEARAFAVQKEKDLENAHNIWEERLERQKLLEDAERDRMISQHRAEIESKETQFRSDLRNMEERLTSDTSDIQRQLTSQLDAQIDSIRKDADVRLQNARQVEQRLQGELKESKAELENSSSELEKASNALSRMSEELQAKTAAQHSTATKLAEMEQELHGLKWSQQSNTSESEKALRLMHDSLTALNNKYEERGCTIQNLRAEKIKLDESLIALSEKYEERGSIVQELRAEKIQLMEQAEALRKSTSGLTVALKDIHSKDDIVSEKNRMLSEMEDSLQKSLMDRESMKNERDLAQTQLKQMHHQMCQVVQDRTSQADLIRTTLESQLAAMQEEFRVDMEKLHEENSRHMKEQKERTQQKIRALEQSTDDLQKDRKELVEQLEVVVKETLTDDHLASLSADNRALRLQVRHLQEAIKPSTAPGGHEALHAPDASVVGDTNGTSSEPSGTTVKLQIEELEEVVVAQNQELKNVLKAMQELEAENSTLHEENRRLSDSFDEMLQTEKTWQRHAIEWGKEGDEMKRRIQQLEEALMHAQKVPVLANSSRDCTSSQVDSNVLAHANNSLEALDYEKARDALGLHSIMQGDMKDHAEFEVVKLVG